MQWLRVLGVLLVTGSFAAGCAKGRDVKSAGKEDKLAYDESGKGKKCDTPSSSCDEVKEPSLDFKEKCRESSFRMKQCGCENLCSGNINADRTGYTRKNEFKTCKNSDDKCEQQETSAAYQDGCENAGGEMMECGCEWLCSKKLKEVIPDPPKEDEKKGDDAAPAAAAAAGGEKKKKDDKPAAGSTESKPSKEQAAKDKAAKDKAAKEQAAKDKADAKEQAARDKAAAKEQAARDKAAAKDKSSDKPDKGDRFKLPE